MIKLKTAPADEPLEIEEVKTHLRVDTSDEDDYIHSLIIAARDYCERYQNRAYISQTWELWLDAWPACFILPRAPLISITSIDYYDTSNVKATLLETDYYVDTMSEPGRVMPAYGKSWTTTPLRAANGICVTFVAGYGCAGDVPAGVKHAMLLLIGHWYENREASTDKPLSSITFAVDNLLWQERVF